MDTDTDTIALFFSIFMHAFRKIFKMVVQKRIN